jgi:hypothetical protein
MIELIIADPVAGIHYIKENNTNVHYRNSDELQEFDADCQQSEPFGKVSYIALSSKRQFLALYSNAETEGNIIVLSADLREYKGLKDTMQLNASSLCWCGNESIVLSVFDKIVIMGPEDQEFHEMKSRTEGMFCMNELDGMRITTSEHTYFLEVVQKSLVDTFRLASLAPSAKLHNAQKAIDFNDPKAYEIIRELGDKKLQEGIETLMHAAEFEHKEVDVLKHLL